MWSMDTSRGEAEHGGVVVCTKSLWLVSVHQLQRSCSVYRAKRVEVGVSFSGDIQDPPGQGPMQPAVGDRASAGGLY